ncbi:hypothetical protein ABMA27_015042 [Loxostege sticticalis]|uniref:Reverse transcriptase n=1 Tax=Loxostege sticticalis TaxID=481309 RepID=A0ABR3I699_LOXSC
MSRGCVQGSVCGPTFWNVILDDLLEQQLPQGCHLQAYADDVLLALESITSWGESVKLNFGPSKTQMIGFSPTARRASVTHRGNQLLFQPSIKLLGVIVDHQLKFINHTEQAITKALGIYKTLQVIEPIITYAAGIWGDAVRYRKVRRKLISLQRGFAIRVVRGFRTISANAAIALAQFTPLDLKVKAVRTVERARLTSRSPYLPADVRLHRPTPPSQLAHPADRLGITFRTAYTEEDVDRACSTTHTRIYTDGSKLDGGEVGAAFVVFRPDHQPVVRKLKLHDSCTVFQAELLAIERAITWASDRHLMDIAVLSDSHSALQELENPASTNSIATLVHTHIRNHPGSIEFVWVKAHAGLMGNEAADAAAKSAALLHRTPDFALFPISHVKRRVREDHHTTHNNRYTTSDKGAHTREWLPDLNSIDTLFKHTNHTFSLTQILTGHGFHRYYLHRFKITHTDKCNCNPNAIQTIEHLIKTCPRYASARDRHERLCSYLDLDPYALQALTTKERALESFLEYVKHIVDTLKEYNST